MQFVCDASSTQTWFRIETESEAVRESRDMDHAVEKHFRQAQEHAVGCFSPPSSARYIERDIGLKDHVRRSMPIFLTLRDATGKALATAMLPPEGQNDRQLRPILVGPSNSDPFAEHAEAIRKLGEHFGLSLDARRCYPYHRG
jgi:hypothetical protein